MIGYSGDKSALFMVVLGLIMFLVLAGCSSLTGEELTATNEDTLDTSQEENMIAEQTEGLMLSHEDRIASTSDDIASTTETTREVPPTEKTPQASQGQAYPEIFYEVVESVDDETAAEFETLVTDDSAELTTEGERLLDHLESASELGAEYRDTVAKSAVESGTIDDEFLDRLDRVLGSPDWFARDALQSGLQDTSGDGLTDGELTVLGLDPAEPDTRIVDLATNLTQDGYDNRTIQYLERVDELREYQDNEYEVWAQAEQLGLLDEATANGTVTEHQLWQLQNNASNRLLNGMEVEFGTDPEVADTSGDGYEDHYLWGPLRDLGLNVSAEAVNVFVEVDTAAGVDPPTDHQQSLIRETFREEPPKEIGPISIDFTVCETDAGDVEVLDDMDEFASENRNVTGLGFHYLFLSNGLEDEKIQGATYTSEEETSWMVVDGTLDSQFGATYEASIIAHELGHTLGIDGDDYEGVDSFNVSIDEYNSVMNYNHPGDDITFSTSEPFNDYERMANQEFGSEYQDRDELTVMWDEGAVDEDALC